MKKQIIFGVVAALLITTNAFSQPKNMAVQGVLKTLTGVPVEGTYNLTFSLYNTASTLLWTQTFTDVLITNGLFSKVLDITNPNIFTTNEILYFGIKVDDSAELSKVALTTVGYSFESYHAKTADKLKDGNVGIGVTDPYRKFEVKGSAAVEGQGKLTANTANPTNIACSNKDFIKNNLHVGDILIFLDQKRIITSITNDGSSLTINSKFDPAPGDSSFSFQQGIVSIMDSSGNQGLFINAQGNVGIGTMNPGAKLDVAGNIAALNSNSNTVIYIGESINNDRLWLSWNKSNKTATISAWDNDPSPEHHNLLIYGKDIQLSPGGNSGLFLQESTNYVGIGTMSPGAKLDVAGDIKVSGIISGMLGSGCPKGFEYLFGYCLETSTSKVKKAIVKNDKGDITNAPCLDAIRECHKKGLMLCPAFMVHVADIAQLGIANSLADSKDYGITIWLNSGMEGWTGVNLYYNSCQWYNGENNQAALLNIITEVANNGSDTDEYVEYLCCGR